MLLSFREKITCKIKVQFLRQWWTVRKSFFLRSSSLVPAVTVSSGPSQVTINKKGGCAGCSCSVGPCPVSLILLKADHTTPSTAPAGRDHDMFTLYLPEVSLHRPLTVLLRLCCVTVDALASKTLRKSGCVCSRLKRKVQFCKQPSGRVFHRLFRNHDRIVSRSCGRTIPNPQWFYINVIVYEKAKEMWADICKMLPTQCLSS